MQTNCPLYCKVVKNSKLKTYRLVFTFDAHNKISLRNIALQTGDIANISDNEVYVQNSIEKAVERAKKQLSTNNIVML